MVDRSTVSSNKPVLMLKVLPQVAQAKIECMVIELMTSCKYKTLYGKLKWSRHGP